MQVDLRRIAEIEVLTPQAERVRLGSLFESKPSVLIWLRHFGCSFCLEQVKVLMSALGEIEETGGQLVLIGQGNPEQALRFQQLKAPGVQVVSATERSVRTDRSGASSAHTTSRLGGGAVAWASAPRDCRGTPSSWGRPW